ncbi:c-type cytochrome [Phragmitibacter flavus]|uniref:C-type cytochrome n=1 Tax=Phragmitibacter flavus TaxID=2576071 RepID=A0A5R8KAV4_9BACT|nr:DUF6797 domain-containing protein [Phragmitibacter flavus]TLD69442.1 c-type cytochrome [Phragmitibacter flavus]
MRRAAIALLLSATFISCAPAKDDLKAKVDTTPWIEPDFPFFSSVLDARHLGEPHAKNNLTPRGIILNLGHNLWACFDTDLLRIACIWQSEEGKPPTTLNALAPGSYQIAGQKTKDGQEHLPVPQGKILLTNGIYPGWQVLQSETDTPTFTDPRPAPFTPEEIGRGPLSSQNGKLTALRYDSKGVSFTISLAGIDIDIDAAPRKTDLVPGITTLFTIAPHEKSLALVLGKIPNLLSPDLSDSVFLLGNTSPDDNSTLALSVGTDSPEGTTLEKAVLKCAPDGTYYVFVPPSTATQHVLLELIALHSKPDHPAKSNSKQKDPFSAAPLWSTPSPLTTTATLAPSSDAAYVTDSIPLPNDNPWHRKVRLADLTFLDNNGNAAGVTFDGDIWLISGLKGDLKDVTWKRYTSGLHEPMSIVARDKDLFVFDRNGIWKILDQNGDGEADTHEMFCNLFTQTAETREFPNSMKLGPDGALYLAKGGQQGTTIGKDNGSVLRIAPDGKSYTTIAHGLRQPFIGVHPKTGLVTASDQQGNYVPSTPFHILKDNQYYGFLSDLLPEEKYPAPIAEPLAWIPHPVNPSGASQVWLTGANMGPLNDECIHIGYNRPELFRVLLDDPANPTRATVVPFSRDLDLPPLNGIVNPADGQLYITGFQVWGTTAKPISGLARIRYTGKPRLLLKDLSPTDKGVLLRFNLPLDPTTAADLASYSIERWNYQRTPKYGSPHLKLDGTPGQEWMQPSSAYLSTDKLSLFLGIPDMKPVMQMRVGWGIKGADGLPAQNSAYFTPAKLQPFDPIKENFGDIQIDLTPKQPVAAVTEEKPTLEQGKRLAEMTGCIACHSIDGSVVGKVGPSWKGLYGSERLLKDGKTKVKADAPYLHESIIDPNAKVIKGYEKFDAGMPIYNGILTESQIQSLILYIKSL